MRRSRLTAITGLSVALLVLPAACGSTPSTSGTLPPIVTTTSTTTTQAPTTTVPTTYVIKKGDTLQKIAAAFGVTAQDLIALNGITNPDKIEAGAVLKIPGPGTVIPTTAPGVLGTTTTT